MKTRLTLILILIPLLALLISSCSNTRHFTDNQYLVTRNKIHFTEDKPGTETSGLQGLIQQKPNKRFLGVMRFKLWAYNRSHRGKDNKFRNWLENTVGERPVILDTSITASSCKEMEKYLGNIGFFYSDVGYSLKLNERSNKARVTYNVALSKPYRIDSINYEIEDPELAAWVAKTAASSLIRTGDIYNVYTLDKERERISIFLSNNGYYGFVKDYIFFEVDSSSGTKEMDIFVKVKNRTLSALDSAGNFMEERHFRYRIGKVEIFPDYDPARQDFSRLPFDTLVDEVHQARSNKPANYFHILYRGKLRINPGILAQSTLIEDGEPYSQKDVQETYKRFGNLSIFKFTDISFVETGSANMPDSGGFRTLTSQLRLQRSPVNQYSIEAEGTNSGGDLGIGGNLTYRNRNIFRNGETFQVKLRGAMEAQRSVQEEAGDQQEFLFFNTFEWGAEAQINFPRFLIPVKMERFPKYFRPNTTISTGINFRKRPTYDRYVLNFSFGYEWQESATKKHILMPFNISSIKVFPTPEFTLELEELDDPRVKNQYTDHLITALQYSFIFNNQNIKKIQNFVYFRADVETSGNIFYLFNNALDSKTDSAGYYRIGSIPYAQYGRLELDFRYYLLATRTNQLVFRLLTGIGLPYGNSDALPFEKGFYLGGANSMRAWIYRGLGPGGYTDQGSNIDKMGDIVIETNIEYRFPIYSFFKGALFYDAGNVWLINENENFPGAEFKHDTFYKQIAMDAGIGLRFDFKFFIFRVDFAMRLRDPSMPQGDRWVAAKGIWFWNFGIGYPF